MAESNAGGIRVMDFVSRGGSTAYRAYRAYRGVFGPPISRDIGARLDEGLQQRYHNHASQEKQAAKAERPLHPNIDLHQLEPLVTGLRLVFAPFRHFHLGCTAVGAGFDRNSPCDRAASAGTFQLNECEANWYVTEKGRGGVQRRSRLWGASYQKIFT